jgi:arsenate reductase (thioredoxin)
MWELRIDISQQRSKPLEEFAGQDFDFVITVCDRARENCPDFPGNPVKLHWPFDDPAEGTQPGDRRIIAFRELRDRIHARVIFFLGEGAYGSNDPSSAS